MIELKDISINDKEISDKLRDEIGIFNGDYCFGNLFAWGAHFKTKAYRTGGLWGTAAEMGADKLLISFPLGSGDKLEIISQLCDYARLLGREPYLGLLPEKLKISAEILLGENVSFSRVRDSDDYVYFTEKLISLPGKGLHSKKNMLNSFLKNPYAYERITPENLDKAKEFCLSKAYTKPEEMVITRFFDYFDTLALHGAILRINDEIVAATVGEKRLDSVIIHIEKAEKDVRGAYAAINNLFLLNDNSDTTYVNREDDMGSVSLRRAKLSYKPDIMIEKYIGKLML